MSPSIDDWFADRQVPGYDINVDDEHVEKQHPYLVGDARMERRSTAARSSPPGRVRRYSLPDAEVRQSQLAQTLERRVVATVEQLMRDGFADTDTKMVVAALARRGVRTTTAAVDRILRDRAAARRAMGQLQPDRVKPKPKPKATNPRNPGPRRMVPKVALIKQPGASRGEKQLPSEGIERGPAHLSPFAQSLQPKVRKRNQRKPSPRLRRDAGKLRLIQERKNRGVSMIDQQPCPACGFHPTINGVCGCQ